MDPCRRKASPRSPAACTADSLLANLKHPALRWFASDLLEIEFKPEPAELPRWCAAAYANGLWLAYQDSERAQMLFTELGMSAAVQSVAPSLSAALVKEGFQVTNVVDIL